MTNHPALAVEVLAEVGLPHGFALLLDTDPDGRHYFQIEAVRTDVCTGQLGKGRGGKAFIDPTATRSELVQMAFGLYRAYLEHEARETFTWRGRRVYGPHMDVAALWSVADHFDARPGPTSLPLEAAS